MFSLSLLFTLVTFILSVYCQQQFPLLSAGLPISKITPEQWKELNDSVEGRLFPGTPLALPCYNNFNGGPNTPDSVKCAEAKKSRFNTIYFTGQMAGLVHGNWGTCQRINQGCPASANIKFDSSCNQGNISSYFIDVRQIQDIQEGLKFASRNEIPIVVKNSGHDYAGRSAGPNSLALWMHNYKPIMAYIQDFVPDGCSRSIGNVVTFGAGQDSLGLYKFAETQQITIVGGSSETVKPAGGWITGGGHSPLSPVYGLSVDNVKQLKVVLPNGTIVIANRCQNQNLYFALRGGGGGTFGVNLEMSVVAHPKTTIQWASFSFPNGENENTVELLSVLVANTNRWHSEGWGGYIYPLGFQTAQVQLMNPRLNAAQAIESLQPLIDLAKSRKATQVFTTYPSFWPLFEKNFKDKLVLIGGSGNAMATRIIPQGSFEGATNRSKLVSIIANALVDPKRYKSFIMICLVAPDPSIKDDDSAVTPSWRNATWQVTSVARWDWASVAAGGNASYVAGAFKATHDAMEELRAMTPGGGAYFNEADMFEPDPIGAFWGRSNYERLMKVKKEVDPKNVMQVYQGVGWDRSADLFTCYP